VVDERVAAFEVVEAAYEDVPGLAVRGEVDLAAVSMLEPALDAAIKTTVGAFVLDLCDLEFLDSAGLRLLLHARALLARDQRELAIICPPGPVRRLFETTGVAELLVLYDSRDDLQAALVPAD
jgi:anti-sigma B factor antagonist